VMMGGTDGSIDALFEIADAVSKHIGMVFHRFIADGRLDVTVNGDAVRAWDPFMSDHGDCMASGPQSLRDGDGPDVVVTGYVLPAHSQLTDDEYERGGGPLGWLEQQGFYVYRADRLLVAGSWLGIGRAGSPWPIERKFSQARISLDITNSDDLGWGIDVRKSMATPPAAFLKRLRQLAEEIRRRAKNSYRAFRTVERAAADKGYDAEVPIWIASSQAGAVPRFRINRRHPVVRSLRGAVKDQAKLRQLLALIDREAPVQPRSAPAVLQATAVDAGRALQEQSIRQLIVPVYYSLRNGRGMSEEEALNDMLARPQLKEHEELVILTIEEYERGRKA
jgi:hypothetical protein